MCDKELLVGYIYDEIDDNGRQRLEAHLASCAECRDEVAALTTTRRHLASWAPPEPRLGFQIVSGAPPAAARRPWYAPAWGLAAAAVLVLAAAAAIANVEVRYDSDGLVVRAGWTREAPAVTPAAPAAAPAAVVPAEWEAVIAAMDGRLRELESQPRAASVAQPAPGPRLSDAEALRRVRDLLTESEERQNRQLAMRIRQLALEMEAQRRVDLNAIQARIAGATEADVASHQQFMNYVQGLYRISQQGK